MTVNVLASFNGCVWGRSYDKSTSAHPNSTCSVMGKKTENCLNVFGVTPETIQTQACVLFTFFSTSLFFPKWNTSKLVKRLFLREILRNHSVRFGRRSTIEWFEVWRGKLGHRNVEHEAFSGHTKSLQLYRFILQPVWSQKFQVIGIQALMSNGDSYSPSEGEWQFSIQVNFAS